MGRTGQPRRQPPPAHARCICVYLAIMRICVYLAIMHIYAYLAIMRIYAYLAIVCICAYLAILCIYAYLAIMRIYAHWQFCAFMRICPWTAVIPSGFYTLLCRSAYHPRGILCLSNWVEVHVLGLNGPSSSTSSAKRQTSGIDLLGRADGSEGYLRTPASGVSGPWRSGIRVAPPRKFCRFVNNMAMTSWDKVPLGNPFPLHTHKISISVSATHCLKVDKKKPCITPRLQYKPFFV